MKVCVNCLLKVLDLNQEVIIKRLIPINKSVICEYKYDRHNGIKICNKIALYNLRFLTLDEYIRLYLQIE